MKCPACDGSGLGAPEHPGYTICRCGCYLSDRTRQYGPRYWEESAGSMEAHRALITSDRLAWWLERITVRGRILEVGCAPGALLDALVARGDDAYGIDPTMADADRVLCGEFPDPDWVDDANAVVMLDVLEHMADPLAALVEARRLLRPGGTIYLQVPTLRGQPMEARFWLPGEHTWIPTQAALDATLARAGFQVTRLDSWHAGHEWTEAVAV